MAVLSIIRLDTKMLRVHIFSVSSTFMKIL